MPTSRRRRRGIPIPESDLEGWGFAPTKRWYATASQDIYRASGRLARKGDRIHVMKVGDRIFFRGSRLFSHEVEAVILL